jgi:nucleotide-binding universal stress UspA family protein
MSATPNGGTNRRLIVCYDGSDAAVDALNYGAALLPGAPALVVTLWKPIPAEALSPAARPPVADPADAEEVPRRAAEQIAAEGVRRASSAGLDAEPLPVQATGPLWEAVETLAEERDALLVMCGTARSGMRSGLPGSLGHALVSHLSRPVLVVPSARATTERRREASEKRRVRRPVAGVVTGSASSRVPRRRPPRR